MSERYRIVLKDSQDFGKIKIRDLLNTLLKDKYTVKASDINYEFPRMFYYNNTLYNYELARWGHTYGQLIYVRNFSPAILKDEIIDWLRGDLDTLRELVKKIPVSEIDKYLKEKSSNFIRITNWRELIDYITSKGVKIAIRMDVPNARELPEDELIHFNGRTHYPQYIITPILRELPNEKPIIYDKVIVDLKQEKKKLYASYNNSGYKEVKSFKEISEDVGKILGIAPSTINYNFTWTI